MPTKVAFRSTLLLFPTLLLERSCFQCCEVSSANILFRGAAIVARRTSCGGRLLLPFRVCRRRRSRRRRRHVLRIFSTVEHNQCKTDVLNNYGDDIIVRPRSIS